MNNMKFKKKGNEEAIDINVSQAINIEALRNNNFEGVNPINRLYFTNKHQDELEEITRQFEAKGLTEDHEGKSCPEKIRGGFALIDGA